MQNVEGTVRSAAARFTSAYQFGCTNHFIAEAAQAWVPTFRYSFSFRPSNHLVGVPHGGELVYLTSTFHLGYRMGPGFEVSYFHAVEHFISDATINSWSAFAHGKPIIIVAHSEFASDQPVEWTPRMTMDFGDRVQPMSDGDVNSDSKQCEVLYSVVDPAVIWRDWKLWPHVEPWWHRAVNGILTLVFVLLVSSKPVLSACIALVLVAGVLLCACSARRLRGLCRTLLRFSVSSATLHRD